MLFDRIVVFWCDRLYMAFILRFLCRLWFARLVCIITCFFNYYRGFFKICLKNEKVIEQHLSVFWRKMVADCFSFCCFWCDSLSSVILEVMRYNFIFFSKLDFTISSTEIIWVKFEYSVAVKYTVEKWQNCFRISHVTWIIWDSGNNKRCAAR